MNNHNFVYTNCPLRVVYSITLRLNLPYSKVKTITIHETNGISNFFSAKMNNVS